MKNPNEVTRSSYFIPNKTKQGGQEVGRIKQFVTQRLSEPPEPPTLFDPVEVTERNAAIDTAQKEGLDYIDMRYTNSATRTLYALSYVISQEEAEDIKAFEEAAQGAYSSIGQSRYITRRIPLGELCHLIFKDRRSKNLGMLIKDLFQLGTIQVAWRYADERGGLRLKIAPILHNEWDIPLTDIQNSLKEKHGAEATDGEITTAWNKFLFYTKGAKYTISPKEEDIVSLIVEAIKKQDYIDITFGRPFFQGKLFAYIPKALITEWGKAGTANEVHPILMNHLLKLQPQFTHYAKKARGSAIWQARKDKLSRDEKERSATDAEQRTLVGKLSLKTLNARLSTDYFATRQFGRLQGYVEASMNFCKDKIGLITEYYFSGKGKSLVLHFTFNKHYGTQKALPSPDIIDTEAE